MKNLLIPLVLSIATAQAAELGVGVTTFSHVPNGVWYQEPFAHDFNLTSPSVSVGTSGYVLPGWKWRAGYWYMGRMSSSALAVSSDEVYATYGANAPQHWPLSHWYGSGYINALYATIAPEFKAGGFTISPELGLNIEKPSWTMTVPDFRDTATSTPRIWTVQNNSSPWLGISWGLSVKYGSTSLAFTRVGIRSGGEYPILAGWYTTKYANNLMVRYDF